MAGEAQVKKAICFWCNAWCRVLVHVEDNHLVSVEEDPESPFKIFPPTQACPRRMAAREWFYHPDRLKYPLKRAGEKGEGKWQQVSWDQALDEIAAKLAGIKKEFGAEAVATTLGTLRTADEYRTRFFNLFGSPNVTGHSAICFGPRSVIGKAIIGWFPFPKLSADAKCVLILGREPSQSWRRIWKSVRDLKEGGAKFIVIDPRYTPSAEIADIWLQVRPGTDCALLMGMMNVIVHEGLYDKEFVGTWCYGFEQFKQRLAEYPLDKVEEITWIPAAKIQAAARLYAGTRPAAIVEGMGVEQSTNIEVLHARYALSAITGNLDIPGGDYMSGPHPKLINDREMELEETLPPEQRRKQLGGQRFKLYGWPGNELLQECQLRVWGKPGGVQHSDNQAHPGLVYRAMLTGDPYQVRGFITLASNPMIKSANTKLVYSALKSLDLHVVVDYWLTPTAELADYVLPAACAFERPYLNTVDNSDSYIIGGERALPSGIPGEYDRRTDFEFWRGLGVRLGQEERWPWTTDEAVYDYRLAPLGLSFQEFMAKGGMELPPPQYKKYQGIGFATPTGKVELRSTILERLGYDPLPKFVEPSESPVSRPDLAKEYPLILITGARHQPFYHSEHRQIDSLRKMHPNPLLHIHPDVARQLGIEDGDWVWVESPRGRVTQKCQYFEGIDPRVVHAQHGWWFPEQPGEEPWLHGAWWSNINVCTDDDPDRCSPIVGTWPARTALCKVYKRKEYKE